MIILLIMQLSIDIFNLELDGINFGSIDKFQMDYENRKIVIETYILKNGFEL